MSGKCHLGKTFCTDGVLNGHTSVMKSAMVPSVSSSVGQTMGSYNHSNGLSGPPAGLKLLHVNNRPDIIPITGDKVHCCHNENDWLFRGVVESCLHFLVFGLNYGLVCIFPLPLG